MGILSEIDMMNRDAEDDAFEVSSDSETVDSFSEEFEPVEPPKPKPQEEEAEEARKKAEFDAAEAKRKAEWEAKQAQKKLREQQELDRLAAIKQRYRTAYGKHSRLYCIAQLDRAAENRAGVHKILRNKVSIPLFA